MRILIDTNIALNYFTGREDKYSSESDEIMRLCAEGKIEGAIAFHSLSTFWYVTRKVPDRNARMPDMDILEQLGDLFEVNLGYLLGQNIPREKPTEPDNETLARWVTEEEAEDIMRMYLKMSPKSRVLVMEAVKAMYKADREMEKDDVNGYNS